MSDVITLNKKEYDQIRELVYDQFGINLGTQKQALVSGRLNKILREQGIASFQDYYQYLISDNTGRGLNTLINRISTNHTFFYREAAHFDFMKERALPTLQKQLSNDSDKTLRVWCAASSSGEEPYTLAMILKEFLGGANGWDARVLATDISETALQKAVVGVYEAENVEKLPRQMVQAAFSHLENGQYQIKDNIKQMVTYRRLNLIRTSFPFKKQFHIIFCRNVMIYFDSETREALVRRFFEHLRPGGFLFIGHSESINRERKLFDYVQPAIYRKP